MKSELLEMAGGDEQFDPRREECLADIARSVDRLRARGMPVGTIVAALAIAAMGVLDSTRT